MISIDLYLLSPHAYGDGPSSEANVASARATVLEMRHARSRFGGTRCR